MPEYRVIFTLGGSVDVLADTEDDAINVVEEMSDDELLEYARDGLDIHDIPKVVKP